MNPDPLEPFVHKTLRGLPDRKAPASLEARVLAELARRQALPWWRQSWIHWPSAVRWTFLVLSAVLAALILYGSLALLGGGSAESLGDALQGRIGTVQALLSTLSAVRAALVHLVDGLPSAWVYGTLAAVASLYALLMGVGAMAYRTLWKTR